MKPHQLKPLFASLLAAGLILMTTLPVIGTTVQPSQPTVNLGTTTSFAVLAGTTITNTGETVIQGDAGSNVGLFPGTSITGQTSMTIGGAVHIADSVASIAKTDLQTAYNDAAGRTPVTRIPSELGGKTLTPGVYDSADGTFQITGTLTLDAQGNPDGVFIFKSASTLITAVDSNVALINSARYCRTFWTVGSSATLGVNSHFVGHIFAVTSIAANTGASVQGQLLAMNGAVTLDNNTITNGVCDETDTPVVVTPPDAETPTPTETPTPVVTPPTTEPSPVTVEAPSEAVTETVTGGRMPDTATPWYTLLLIGAVLVVAGAVSWKKR